MFFQIEIKTRLTSKVMKEKALGYFCSLDDFIGRNLGIIVCSKEFERCRENALLFFWIDSEKVVVDTLGQLHHCGECRLDFCLILLCFCRAVQGYSKID